MRAGYIMERSHLSCRHLGTSRAIFLIFLLYLLSIMNAKASQLKVAVSTLNAGMAVERVQSGLDLELTRLGYVIGTDLIWLDSSQSVLSDVNVTISMTENTPLISLVNQQGLSSDIYLEKRPFGDISHVDFNEYYQVNFIRKLLPGISVLGVIIDRNASDILNVTQFLAQQEQKGVRVIYHYIDDNSDLRASARVLAPQVNAIYLPRHITDMADINKVVTVAERNNVALIGEDHDSVNKGLFAVYNIDYVQVGRDAADLLVDLAQRSKGVKRDSYVAQPVLSINLDAAARMGVELSSEVINKAKYIIE